MLAQWFVAVRGALMELVRGALPADNHNVVLLECSTLTQGPSLNFFAEVYDVLMMDKGVGEGNEGHRK